MIKKKPDIRYTSHRVMAIFRVLDEIMMMDFDCG